MCFMREAKIKRLDKSVIIGIPMYAIITARILVIVQNVKIKSLWLYHYTLIIPLSNTSIQYSPFNAIYYKRDLLAASVRIADNYVFTLALGPRWRERLPRV